MSIYYLFIRSGKPDQNARIVLFSFSKTINPVEIRLVKYGYVIPKVPCFGYKI